MPQLTLPSDSAERKEYPIWKGCVRYFPAVLALVSNISKKGNDKHNPGQEMHHARGKSMDHEDCLMRHMVDAEDLLAARERGNTSITNAQILEEVGQANWRVMAWGQEICEKLGAPLAPAAKV